MLFAHAELAPLSIGIACLLIALAVEWNAILNHIRLRKMSLALVERKHPRLPGSFEITIATLLTIAFIILFFQFVHRVYAATFTLHLSTTEVKNTIRVVISDINGDGKLDWIAGNNDLTNTFRLDSYVNDGAMGFTASVFDTSLDLKSMKAGDIDGDGDIDLVTSTSSNIYKLVNNGAGTFTSTSIATVGMPASGIAVADFNNDGSADIAWVSTANVTMSIYLNDGHGNFTAANSTLPAGTDATPGDFNGDGALDLVINRTAANSIVYLNSGTGAFIQSATLGSIGKNAVGDLDNDGDLDILNTASSGPMPYFNNGLGTNFTQGVQFGTIQVKQDTSLADVDNDGDLDAVIAGSDPAGTNGGSQVSLNNGNGAFPPFGAVTEVADYTHQVAIGDLDNDGDVDYISGTDETSGGGAGRANRVYKNDQAATIVNTAPTAPSNLSGSKVSDNGTLANITLTWGSGSDSQTSTRLLQYQVKLGTGSNTHNFVSGKTASPNWVNRLIPNNKSRQYALKNLPCGHTFIWSVAAVDTGFKQTWSSEHSFTLSASCVLSNSGGGSSSTTTTSGGGGGAAWLLLLRSHKASEEKPDLGYGIVTFSAFDDIDGNGKRGSREINGFGGLPISIEGKTIDGQTIKRTIFLPEEGSLKVKIRESDTYGYKILFDRKSTAAEDFLPTKGILQTITVKNGKTAEITAGFQRKNLLRLLPCLHIGEGREGELEGSAALTLLQRLTDIYGSPVSRGVNLETPLMSRRDFLTLLQRTECIDLLAETIVREKLETSFKGHTVPGWDTLELLDLPLSPYTSDTALVYSLLAQGIGVARSSAMGSIADLSSPISRREAILLTEAAMKIPEAKRKTSGAVLPDDLRKHDALVPSFQALSNLGALPESFLPILGTDQGLNTSEAPTLLVRSAFRAGRIDLLPPFRSEGTEDLSFLSVLPPFTLPPCLQRNEERSSNIFFTDVLPGSDLSDRIRSLLAYGTQGADNQMLWLLAGTPVLSEFGVENAETILRPSDPVSMIEVLRGLLILSCLPPESRASILTSNSNPFPIGSGESRIARDRLFGLPRDSSLASRLSYRSQDRIKLFDLSLFSFAAHLLTEGIRKPAAPLSLRDASELLSSALLGILVKNEMLTYGEAEEKMQELSHTLLEELLGTTMTDRNAVLGDQAVITQEHFVRFLSSVTKKGAEKESADSEEDFLQIDSDTVLHDSAPPMPTSLPTSKWTSLGQQWWGRVE